MDREINPKKVPTLALVAIDVTFGATLVATNLMCGEYAGYISIILIGIKPIVSAKVENYYSNTEETT